MIEEPKADNVMRGWDLAPFPETSAMVVENYVRQRVREHISTTLQREYVKFMIEQLKMEQRRARFLKFMKHRNRRGANVRIAVEQRKAAVRYEERHFLLCSCHWMREEIERANDSED